ncbi:MAG: hypothetical protein R3F60_29590 [bacterium]
MSICAACGASTPPGPECEACGGSPRLFDRFSLSQRLGTDSHGIVYGGTADDGVAVRVRLAEPADETVRAAWVAAAEAWQVQGAAGIAPPLAAGSTADGRFARVEEAIDGQPVRRSVGLAATLAVLERLLDILATLHASGVAHGGIGPDSLSRRADGVLVLTDFAPAGGQPADDLLAVARLARVLARDPLPPSVTALLARMESADPAARPTAAQAREAVHHARAARPATSPSVHLPPPPAAGGGGLRRVVLLALLAAVAGAYFVYQRRADPDAWEGTLPGRITRTEGPAPIRSGECSVYIDAVREQRKNCRIEIECGGTRLYGGGEYGLNRCAGYPPRAEDVEGSVQDGDPRLELYGDRGLVRVWDQRYEKWTVEIALDIPTAEE